MALLEPEAPSPEHLVAESEAPRTPSPFMRPIEVIAAGLLLVVVVLLLVGALSRYLFSLPIIWGDEVASISFIWLAMLGSVIAIDRNEHLRLTLFLKALSGPVRRFVDTFALLLVAAFLLAMAYPAFEYAMEESFITLPALGISASWRAAALPVGICAMAALALAYAVRGAHLRDLLGGVAIIVVVLLALWFARPELIKAGTASMALFLLGFVALCLIAGVPIAFCFGIGTVSYLTFATHVPLIVMVGRMDEGMSGLILLSVPVFVLLGCVLDYTGMGRAIVDFLGSLLGHVKAGMSYVLLGSLFVVSGISGSKVSDMATVAPALFPEMKRRGHKPKEMIALLATGAAMADTVPPSIVLIVLGSVAGVSIAALFTSGFVVAMVLLAVLAGLARLKAQHEDMRGVTRPTWNLIWKTMLVAFPALVLPFLIRWSVSSGLATATEVSTIAVAYALFIGVVLYGGITPKTFYVMLVETAALTGAILIILACAVGMAWAITQAGLAAQLAAFMAQLPGGWIAFMALSIILFLVLGCILEGLPAIVLMAPLVYPIARNLGINDVHYSMVIVTAMNIGLMTPPIGIGFYLACKIGQVPPDEAIGAIWPYLVALLVGLVLIAAVPWISIGML